MTYDVNNDDVKGKEYAKVKPHKVIDAMKEFSKPQYKVDVLKVEVPVNMKFVEGYGDEVIHSREEALQLFKEQSDATTLPFIFLSAGVSAQLFQDTLTFAKEAGSPLMVYYADEQPGRMVLMFSVKKVNKMPENG